MNHLVFVTGFYPTKETPAQAFVQPIARGIADLGIQCTVISPQSISRRLKYGEKKRPKEWYDETAHGNRVRVIQPNYVSLSSKIVRGVSLTALSRSNAIRRALRQIKEPIDAAYAHFWQCGIEMVRASKNKIPVIVASGEETIRVENGFGQRLKEKYLSGIKGVIAVSTKNLKESNDCGLLEYHPDTTVLINSIDPSMFYPMCRAQAREKLKLSQEGTIAIFVGSFEHRKGPDRVVEAAKKVPGLKLIIAGVGKNPPKSDQVLFTGSIPHEELVTYLNAADFFVLPTLAEGCCNAIIEAMACGLPVISSDRPFNDDVMTAENSIRIEPTDIDDIAQAMDKLTRDKELRERLAQGALASASGLQIENRVKKIVAFMENVLDSSREQR